MIDGVYHNKTRSYYDLLYMKYLIKNVDDHSVLWVGQDVIWSEARCL